jgi:hypothetical protein
VKKVLSIHQLVPSVHMVLPLSWLNLLNAQHARREAIAQSLVHLHQQVFAMLVTTVQQAAQFLNWMNAQQAPSANKALLKVGHAPLATTTLTLAWRLSKIALCAHPANTVTALQPLALQVTVLLDTTVWVAPVLMISTLLLLDTTPLLVPVHR